MNPKLTESELADAWGEVQPIYDRLYSQHKADIISTSPTYTLPEYAKREWKIGIENIRLEILTKNTLDAIADANSDKPFVFIRSGDFVRIIEDENNIPSISEVNESALKGIAERCALYGDEDDNGIFTPVQPPLSVIRDLAEIPDKSGIPPLSGITQCPIILKNGNIVTVEGYNNETRLYYTAVDGLSIPKIPENPTKEDAIISMAVLAEVFINFPFEDEASRTNNIAILLSLVNRPLIDGNIPMALIDKPTMGTGASLINEVIGIIACGRVQPMVTAPGDDDEWRKKNSCSTLCRKKF